MLLLHGWRDIADCFGVKHTTVRQWAQAGAPIYVLEDGGRPTAEVVELWAWLKEHSPHAGRVEEEGSVAQIKKAMQEEEEERMRRG